MFTGIINSIGTIIKIKKKADKIFFIETKLKLSDLKVGSSISCSGVCLTIIQKGKKKNNSWFTISASKETLSKSNIQYWKKGTMINLEKSLKIGDELSGHLVFGHIDGLSKILSIKKVGDSLSLVCELLPFLNNYIISKGSISLNGVSLTVNQVTRKDFKVNIVNYTKKNTTFKDIKIGDLLNVEIDMLARYVRESLR
tara:strand:+ start:1432 stop:2025 length:594 start_codon:yes stop_codon:yes gene_type:complete